MQISQWGREVRNASLRTAKLMLFLLLPLSALGAQAPAAAPQEDLSKVDIGIITERASHNDPAAQFELGNRFVNGYGGVSSDMVTAISWLTLAANQGLAKASDFLGQLYLYGVPTIDHKPDPAQALIWYHKAADQGYAPSMRMLGIIYTKGTGVPRDLEQAAAWYRKAAELGDVQSQIKMGDLYIDGRGVIWNWDEAIIWYRKAAAQGDTKANRQLEHIGAVPGKAALVTPPLPQPSPAVMNRLAASELFDKIGTQANAAVVICAGLSTEAATMCSMLATGTEIINFGDKPLTGLDLERWQYKLAALHRGCSLDDDRVCASYAEELWSSNEHDAAWHVWSEGACADSKRCRTSEAIADQGKNPYLNPEQAAALAAAEQAEAERKAAH